MAVKPVYSLLQSRVVALARARVRNGEFSERALARHLRISQPHLHNVLCGVRPLTPETMELILEGFGLSLLDVFTPEELRRNLAARERSGRD